MPTSRSSQLRVLLVEDNPADERLLRAILDEARSAAGDFALSWVTTLGQAMARVEVQHFDACLLDLGLPDAMGLEALERMRRAAPHIAIVVLTGLDEPGLGRDAIAAGAQDALVKDHIDGVAVGRALGHAVERQRSDAQVRQLNADLELRVQERTRALAMANEQLEAFVHAAYHEMKAPLRSLAGLVTLLSDEQSTRLDAEGVALLERAQRAVERMDGHINALQKLALVAREAVRSTTFDLATQARSVFGEIYERHSDRAITFRCPDRLMVDADEHLVRMVLQNLISNAVKFTGKATIARIELGVLGHENPPVYFLRDNGEGFDMAYVDKLFRPFKRLHRHDEFPGTGIGLAATQRIVRMHGGDIWAEAEAGAGACFFFTLSHPPEPRVPA